MSKRILPQLIGLSIGLTIGGAAFAQTATQQTTTTQATAAQPAANDAQTTTTTTTTFSKPAGALSEEAIKGDIAKAGYKEVKDLEFKNGVWQTKARGGDKDWKELKVGPLTGKVYAEDAPSKLNEDEVKAKLTAAGYTNIGHVKYDDGLWSADADTKAGKDVDLLVDPDDGSVVAKSQD
ncbi:MAG: PepSY domain-containing protein [Rhodanobacteraceae bacterium]